VVGDEHQRPGGKTAPDAARGVRKHERLHSEAGEDPDRERGRARGMSLVQVKPSALRDHLAAGETPRHQLAPMAFDRRQGKPESRRTE
jgi:hypothetical protein